MERQQSELHLARQSTALRFLGTLSNGHNDVHHFAVTGTPYSVALHENDETGKVYAVWLDSSRSSSRDGRYPRLAAIFDSLPEEVQTELLRLRPLFSRRVGKNGVGECDMLAERE